MKREEVSRVKQLYHSVNSSSEASEIDYEINDAFFYHLFAERYGWTPEDVDKTPYKILLYMVEIIREANASEAMSNRLLRRAM